MCRGRSRVTLDGRCSRPALVLALLAILVTEQGAHATPLHAPRAAADSSDARVTAVRNGVDKFTPQQRRARKDDRLKPGDRLSTEQDASAEIALHDGSRLELGGNTLVVVRPGTSGSPDSRGDQATLVSGGLQVHLGELVQGRTWSIAAGAGRMDMEDGDARLQVDEAKTTRLAVYSGCSTLVGEKSVVRVFAGYGSKLENGAEPTPPRPLPPAPVWQHAPPPFVLAQGTGGFQATYAAGPGHPASGWHIQVAGDEGFHELRIDTTAAASVTTLAASELPVGRWYARVSALDEDRFEGPFLTTAPIDVAQVQLSAGAPGSVRVKLLTSGIHLMCGIDEGPRTLRAAPFEVAALTERDLRCAPADEPGHFADLSIPPVKLTLTARLVRSGSERGVIEVSVHDASGQFLPGLPVAAHPQAPLTVGSFQERDGLYRAEASWPPDTRRIETDLKVSEDRAGMKFSVNFAATEGAP